MNYEHLRSSQPLDFDPHFLQFAPRVPLLPTNDGAAPPGAFGDLPAASSGNDIQFVKTSSTTWVPSHSAPRVVHPHSNSGAQPSFVEDDIYDQALTRATGVATITDCQRYLIQPLQSPATSEPSTSDITDALFPSSSYALPRSLYFLLLLWLHPCSNR